MTSTPKRLSERPLVACAAIILNEQDGELRLLVAKRKQDAKIEAGKWEFPGGKLDFGEAPEECLVREIKEELDLDIEVESLFDVVSHLYKDPEKEAHIILLCYLCKSASQEFHIVDVADAKWITPDEFDHFDWAQADLPPLEKLKAWFDQRAMSAR
jgi:8-oxo-dGTP diphosphatase